MRYRYVEIPALGTNVFGTYNGAVAVNAAGKVVGFSSTSNGSHAYAWKAGQTTDLGVLRGGAGGAESQGLGVNDSGVVVGATQVDGPGDTGQHAFVFRQGKMVDLGTGYAAVRSGSAALAVNESGQVVGVHDRSQDAAVRAVSWQDGKLTELPDLGVSTAPSGIVSQANAINDAGQIVGVATPRDPKQSLHGVLWQNGVLTDLGNLGGTSSDTTANDINDHGVIVGRSYTGRQLHAFVWRAGVMRDLGALGPNYPDGGSEAFGVNDRGVAVGYSRVATGTHDGPDNGLLVATVWRNGVAVDLNGLVTNLPKGKHLSVAHGINDDGVIVGQVCTVASGCSDEAAFVLVPIR